MKLTTTVRMAACAMIFAGALTGCNNDKKHAEAASDKAMVMANTKCPYSGAPVNMSVTRPYHGKTVGFCCADCEKKWDKASDAERDAMLAKCK